MPTTNEELIDLLRDVNRGIGKFVKDVLAEHDISIAMGAITRQIDNDPGVTISELARRTGIAKSHISNTISELEKRGWVEKKEDAADQRLFHLHLTPTGGGYLSQVRTDVRKRINELAADVPKEQALAVIEGLSYIKSALDRLREKENT
ncbi:MAG: MarR family winged helix-turn-helix transcriptional regulator [Methylocystaceae bacterium]